MSEWFCKIAGREIGPLSAQQLKSMARSGQLLPDDPIRQGAAGKWAPAGRAKGLFPESADEKPEVAPSAPATEPAAPAVPIVQVVPTGTPVQASPSAAAPVVPNLPQGTVVPTPPAASPPVSAPPVPAGLDFGPTGPGRSSVVAGRAAQGVPDSVRRKRRRKKLVVGGAVAIAALVAVLGVVIAMRPGSGKAVAAAATDAAPEEVIDLASLQVQKAGDPSAPDLTGALAAIEAADAAKAEEEKWHDAASESARLGDLEVRIQRVEVGPADYSKKAATTDTDEPCLLVRLVVTNHGEGDFRYRSWPARSKGGVVLEDAAATAYGQKPAVLGEQLREQIQSEVLGPGKSAEDLLAFELPGRGVEELRLTLPGETVGQTEPFCFKIPKEMIGVAAVQEPDDRILSESRGGPEAIQRGIAEVGGGDPNADPEEDVVAKMNADIESIGGGDEDTGKEYDMEEMLQGDERFAPPPLDDDEADRASKPSRRSSRTTRPQ